MNARPVPHHKVDPGCYGCGYGPEYNCGDVCAACRCRWSLDDTSEPNTIYEWCESGSCPCHTWAFVDAREMVGVEESLEQAWKDVGYTSSLGVYQAEGR